MRKLRNDNQMMHHQRSVWKVRRRRYVYHWVMWIIGLVVLVFMVVAAYAYYNYRNAADNSYYPTQRHYQRNPQKQIHQKGALSVMFLGTETRDLGTGHQGSTDTMIVMTLNPAAGRTTVTSLPKNAEAQYHGRDVRLEKLYDLDGVPAVTQYVQKTLRIPVDYYVLSDMKGLAKTAGQVGGINVTPSQTFAEFQAGKTQKMGQKRILAYLKATGSSERADEQRQIRNKQVLLALFNKIAHHPLNASAANSLSSDVHTDLSFNDLERLALHYRGAAQNKRRVSLDQSKQDVLNRVQQDSRYARLSPQQKQKVIQVIKRNLGI